MVQFKSPAERLVVAADYTFESWKGLDDIRKKVLTLAKQLSKAGAVLKIGPVLRALGYPFINRVKEEGCDVFADLKLDDTKKTLSIDASFMKEFTPKLLTVKCSAGTKSLVAVREALPQTKILGVTVLTNLDDDDCRDVYVGQSSVVTNRLALLAHKAALAGIVMAASEIKFLQRSKFNGMMILTPAVRPEGLPVKDDDQNPEKIVTVEQAFKAGADMIVVGRSITEAIDPYKAAMITIDQIVAAQK